MEDKYTGMIIWNYSFYIKRRINNTGWMMKWWWWEGVERGANPNIERMLNVLIYIFLHQKRKQCLEFALPKPGEIWNHLAGAYISNSHTRGLHYLTFVHKKQAEKWMQWVNRFKEKCLRKAQHYQSSLKEEKPLQFESTNIVAKKPQPLLWKRIEKGREEKENLWPLAHNAKYSFTYENLDPGDGWNPMMYRWNSQITSDC